MRVVLDANILVSAAIRQGSSFGLVHRWLDRGDLEVVICPELLSEVQRVLDRPRLRKYIDPALVELYLATIRRIAMMLAEGDANDK